MQTTTSSAHTVASVLLLSQKESSVRTEVSSLRALGVTSIEHQHTTSEAISFLNKSFFLSMKKEPAVQAIICDELFENQLIFHFLLKLIKKPHLVQIPILLLTNSKRTAEIARQCGVSVLSRPYTQQQLAEALAKATSPLQSAINAKKLSTCCESIPKKSREKVTKAAQLITTSDYMKRGMSFMKSKKLEEAEQDFLAVLKRNRDHVEANLALAKIYRMRGDAPATTSFILRAAAACQRNKDTKQLESIRSLLPERMRNGNILQQEALMALRAKDYRKAAHDFLEYCEENPDQPLYAAIARSCQLTSSPYESLVNICNAYANMGKQEISDKIRTRLIAEPGSSIQLTSSWLDNFPRLREIVYVASFTARAWRHA